MWWDATQNNLKGKQESAYSVVHYIHDQNIIYFPVGVFIDTIALKPICNPAM